MEAEAKYEFPASTKRRRKSGACHRVPELRREQSRPRRRLPQGRRQFGLLQAWRRGPPPSRYGHAALPDNWQWVNLRADDKSNIASSRFSRDETEAQSKPVGPMGAREATADL